MKKKLQTIIAVTIFLIVFPFSVQAGPIVMAMEEILNSAAFGVDLERTRSTDLGFILFEDNDQTIRTENNVSALFGLFSLGDVSYTHQVSWADPAVSSYISAELEIEVFGSNNRNDAVFIENFIIPIGFLNSNNVGTTTTTFGTNNGGLLDLILGDGSLDVLVKKNLFGNRFDAIDVFRTKLTANYNAVPEPATLFLFGSGLVALGFIGSRRLKKRARREL